MSNSSVSIHDFPYPVAPDTWVLNETYLGMMNDLAIRWAEKGYMWKFGVEVNFKPLAIFEKEPRDFEKYRRLREHFQRMEPRTQNDLAAMLRLNTPEQIKAQRHTIAPRLIKAIKDKEIPLEYFRSISYSPTNLIHDIEGYDKDLRSSSEKKRIAGTRSLFMAYMHLMPLSQGGLRDAIDPRFGNYIGAYGWYDGDETDAEVRLSPQLSHGEFIRNYHQLLVNLQETGLHIGVAAQPEYNHLHFSLLEVKTQINVMESELPEHVEMRRQLMQGLTYFIARQPGLLNDHRIDDQNHIHSLDIGTSRARDLRQRPNTWEYRGERGSEILHLARDMSLLMAGGYAGVYADKPDGTRYLNDLELDVQRKPLVAFNSFQAVSGIKSSLEHCFIKEDGTLVADVDAIYWNRRLMLREVGLSKSRNKTTCIDGQKYDLDTYQGWYRLFGLLKIEDGRIVTPEGLDPEIATVFKNHRVTGYRTAFASRHSNLQFGLAAYLRLPEQLHDGSLLAKVAGKNKVARIKDFYEDYEVTKSSQIASRFTFSLGLWLQNEKFDRDLFYAVVWSQIISPSTTQLVYDLLVRQRDNKSGRVKIRQSTIGKRKSILTALKPVFDEAIDAELAYQKDIGQDTNFVIAALEDARLHIGHFTEDPKHLLSPALHGSAEYALEETDSGPEKMEMMLHFHKSYVIALSLLMMGDKDVKLPKLAAQIVESRIWLEEAFAEVEQKNPEKTATQKFQDNKFKLLAVHDQAIKQVARIIKKFEAGKPASLKIK